MFFPPSMSCVSFLEGMIWYFASLEKLVSCVYYHDMFYWKLKDMIWYCFYQAIVSEWSLWIFHKPTPPFGRRTTPVPGPRITMVINHIQVLGWSSKYRTLLRNRSWIAGLIKGNQWCFPMSRRIITFYNIYLEPKWPLFWLVLEWSFG